MRFLYILIFIAFQGLSQSEIPVGTVVPEVKLSPNGNESYAIYLPRDYSAKKMHSTVFLFDHKGRGASAVQQFTIGAELTNTIVIGANYALNDTLSIAHEEIGHFLNEVDDTYSIDSDKIILGGSYEGALATSSYAQLLDNIYGVIAIEDVMFNAKKLRKNSNLKITILSGDKNLNYYKLNAFKNNSKFENNLISHHIFDGMGWPDAGYLARSLTDLLIENKTPEETVVKYYETDLAFGDLLYKRQQHLEAYDFVSTMKSKYKGLINIKAQKTLLKKIRTNKSYRVKRDEHRIFKFAETSQIKDFQFFLMEDSKNTYFENLGWWGSQMDQLDANIDSLAQNSQVRKSAIRLKGYVQYAVEKQYESLKSKQSKIEKLLFINVLRTLVNPKNYEAFQNVIALSAQEGDYNAAHFYLEELLLNGFDNYEELYEIPYTTPIRISPEWNNIIKKFFNTSKYY